MEPNSNQDVQYEIRQLLEMLKDPINHLYTIFATPIIDKFERINAQFQAETGDPEKFLGLLNQHHKSLRMKVKDKHGSKLAHSQMDYGAHFLSKLQPLITKWRTTEESNSMLPKVGEMKPRCCDFLLDCVDQVEKRLPTNKDVFKGMSVLALDTYRSSRMTLRRSIRR